MRFCSGGKAVNKAQRVETKCRTDDYPAMLKRGIEIPSAELILDDNAGVEPEHTKLEFRVLLQPLKAIPRTGHCDLCIPLPFGDDFFLNDDVAHEFDGIDLGTLISLRIFQSILPDHRLCTEAVTSNTAETTVASGCAPPYVPGLKHPDIELLVAAKMISSREPRIAAANDRDVALLIFD